MLRSSFFSTATLRAAAASRMPVTRSASRIAAQAIHDLRIAETPEATRTDAPAEETKTSKRKAPSKASSRKKARAADKDADEAVPQPPAPKPPAKHVQPVAASGGAEELVPAELTFSFEVAKSHLIGVDPRFEDIFSRLKCRPFEHLERVDPFRTLTHSILGQQISWLAARSITHKFIRLFDPSLPEKPTDHHGPDTFFPTAHQVIQMDIPTLRTAGLSQRKAEYILDLAARFADGRLSTEKLLEAEDEELYELLTAVRGIGRWTVDMFAIFSLRRPDILPVGDLGVQRGILRWFLSLHSPDYNLTISPKKLPRPDEDPSADSQSADPDVLPSLAETSQAVPDASSAPPAPATPEELIPKAPTKKRKTKAAAKDSDSDNDNMLPTPFTPSIKKTLNAVPSTMDIPPLPKGLTVSQLKTRLEKKTKIKGAFITPQEMEELTAQWRPFRSLAVYYMWALAEESK